MIEDLLENASPADRAAALRNAYPGAAELIGALEAPMPSGREFGWDIPRKAGWSVDHVFDLFKYTILREGFLADDPRYLEQCQTEDFRRYVRAKLGAV